MNARVPVFDVQSTVGRIDELEKAAKENSKAIGLQEERIDTISDELENQMRRSEQLRRIVRCLVVIVIGLVILVGVLFYTHHSLTELIDQLIVAVDQFIDTAEQMTGWAMTAPTAT